MSNMTNSESVIVSLNEAIFWCSRYAQSKDAGSTTRIIPFSDEEIVKSYKSTFDQQIRCVEGLIVSRHKLVDRKVSSIDVDMLKGEVLRYEISNTDACGLSPSESNGYIDYEDMPGWDTWFHIYENSEFGACILSWVPPSFIPLAQAAIDVNPVDCIKFVNISEELEIFKTGVNVVNLREKTDVRIAVTSEPWWRLWK